MADKPQSAKSYREIQSVTAYRRLMKGYYLMAKNPRWFGKKVAWITSGGPVEPLYAMGVLPFYPENYGAMCGAARSSVSLCEIAERKGYSRDLCSYARGDIGSSLSGQGPLGTLPPPDFLVCGNNICGTVMKWYEIQARQYGVPVFFLDTPFIHDRFEAHTEQYVQEQLQEFAGFLEKQLKKPFSLKKLERVGANSLEAVSLWKEILELSRNRPAPFAAFDAFIHMAPIVTLRGTRWAVRYYRKLKKELEERVRKGQGAFAREDIRLVWDNIPIWYDIRHLSRLLAAQGAVLVADTYTSAWTLSALNLERPLESLARSYATVHLNMGLEYKIRKMAQLVTDYQADGFIMHSNRSCKTYSLGQYDIKKKVSEITGKPGLILEADHTDARCYTPQQAENLIQTFLEMVKKH
ncbi:MAG: 2-hydroxyacyl-CoA dehydratase family protein [Desulfobacterota bacterium]|jgi:benzoyl-CoA reductase/2-hydroxyglutaryl-CoA dehydratase subunit BcrC/BadD/HgdB|nr:2-hydroxyacyl-CoA dehydratase family protein [Thermodesulfobacteriota bacterium]